MNILEQHDFALATLPGAAAKKRLPKVNPRLVAREHIEAGVPTISVMQPGGEGYYHLSPQHWQLLQLFDGERTYPEIAELFHQQTGVSFSEDDIREFVDVLGKTELFYKSPAEKSAALFEEIVRKRHKRTKREFDFTEIQFSAWDPDSFLTRIYPKLKFLYSRWFSLLCLALFAFMLYAFLDRWGEIANDSLQYYTFSEKGLRDLAEFWVLFGFLVFLHESAHGLTCKHFGGGVHRMGFILMYLAPAFFCDVSEVWVHGRKWQRIATMIAGIWSEMVICALATIAWWGTAPGMWVHDFAYKMMLISGIAVLVINLNPLIKLDGYFILCELLGTSGLKESSTAYVSSWVRNRIFRLPVEVEYISRRNRIIYVTYAVLSGIYSYLLLFAVVKLTYNIFHRYTPEWAFLPALWMAWIVFQSRIKNLAKFMNTVYLDKKERLRAWFTPQRVAVVSAAVLLVLFVPVWRQTIDGRFALEASSRAVLRASVPGWVETVNFGEGQLVPAGSTVAQLRNLNLKTESELHASELRLASARARGEELAYTPVRSAEFDRRRVAAREQVLRDELLKMRLTSPISGVVVTPHLRDLVGSYVGEGTTVAEIADLATLRARIFVPEFSMRDLRMGKAVAMRIDGRHGRLRGTVSAIAPASSEIEEGLIEKPAYKGIKVPHYYVVTVTTDNPGDLKEGQPGEAKIFIRRRSLAAVLWEPTRDFFARRLW